MKQEFVKKEPLREPFTIKVAMYRMDAKRFSYMGGTYVDNYTYIGLQGISKINRYGEIASSP
jgi:hypothetical protein